MMASLYFVAQCLEKKKQVKMITEKSIVIIGIQDIIKKQNLNLYDGDKEKQFYGLKSYDIQKPS